MDYLSSVVHMRWDYHSLCLQCGLVYRINSTNIELIIAPQLRKLCTRTTAEMVNKPIHAGKKGEKSFSPVPYSDRTSFARSATAGMADGRPVGHGVSVQLLRYQWHNIELFCLIRGNIYYH